MTRVDRQDRIRSAAIVAACHVALGYLLIAGLGVDVRQIADERLKLFAVSEALPPPPLPEPIPPPERSRERAERIKPAPKGEEGSAAPPNLRSSPTQIVAPERAVELPVPTPVVAAPVAGPGAQASAGAAPVPGPGTGAGGQGTGLGSGRGGNGTGGGGGGGLARPAEYLGGEVHRRDVPPCGLEGEEPCSNGTVFMRLLVLPNGRVGRCIVERSSGDRILDQATCRATGKRLRYRPARDPWGRRVAAWVRGEQQWEGIRLSDRWIEADVPEDE